jgi:hypothetical protein
MNSQKININPQQSYKPILQQSKYKSKSNVTSSNNITYIVGGVFLILIIIYVFNILTKTDDDTQSEQVIEPPVDNREVFHIKRNLNKDIAEEDKFFSNEQAEDACKVLNSDLATYDQLVDAANNGMKFDECGWITGDTSTPFNLESVFINGNEITKCIPDEELEHIGVNCYGVKPNMDGEFQATIAAINTEQQEENNEDIENTQDFAKLVNSATILPFNEDDNIWSQQRGNDEQQDTAINNTQ